MVSGQVKLPSQRGLRDQKSSTNSCRPKSIAITAGATSTRARRALLDRSREVRQARGPLRQKHDAVGEGAGRISGTQRGQCQLQTRDQGANPRTQLRKRELVFILRFQFSGALSFSGLDGAAPTVRSIPAQGTVGAQGFIKRPLLSPGSPGEEY
jgi:hypothetical protein